MRHPRRGPPRRGSTHRATLSLLLGLMLGLLADPSRAVAQFEAFSIRHLSVRGSGELCPDFRKTEFAPMVFLSLGAWHPSADRPARCTIEIELTLTPGLAMEPLHLPWSGSVKAFATPSSNIALTTSYRIEGASEHRTATYKIVNDDFEAPSYTFRIWEETPAFSACSTGASAVRITVELTASLTGPETPGQTLSLGADLSLFGVARPCDPPRQP